MSDFGNASSGMFRIRFDVRFLDHNKCEGIANEGQLGLVCPKCAARNLRSVMTHRISRFFRSVKFAGTSPKLLAEMLRFSRLGGKRSFRVDGRKKFSAISLSMAKLKVTPRVIEQDEGVFVQRSKFLEASKR